MASTTVVENIKLDTTQVTYAERSETPSPTGPLLVTPPSYQLSGPTSMSTTWLKLNSTGPIRVHVEQTTETLDNEPFSGAKKLRFLLENTDELIVCPGVYDGLSARTAIELGFKSLYMVSHIIFQAICRPLAMLTRVFRLVPAPQPPGLANLTLPLHNSQI